MPEVTTIGGAVVLVLIIIGVFCYYKFCVPKSADKDNAVRFIEGYKSVFESTVKKIIEEIDITKYKTIEEFESDIFRIAYDECWDYTEKALQEAMSNSAIGSLVAKCITKEAVEEVVRKMIELNFTAKMQATYTGRIKETSEKAIEEDARLQAEADAYETGEKEIENTGELEYDKLVKEEAAKADPANFNPQSDEEGGYDSDDPSQEIVE